MITKISGKRVSAIVTVLPQNEYGFEENILAESMKRVERLKRIMGFDKRRRAKRDTVISDLYLCALDYLIDSGVVQKDEIGAVISTSFTPDYYVPGTSSVLHGLAQFSDDVLCMDVPHGCAGYLMGLVQACLLLDKMDKKVLLFTGEIFNRKYTEKEAKYSVPNFGGDAASVTIIENDDSAGDIFFDFKTNGKDGGALLMPGGAFRHPMYYGEPFVFMDHGEQKGYLSTNMEGSAVFNFIQRDVPPLIHELCEYAGVAKENIDYYMFHQPNRYILEKLAERMKVPADRMPMNIVEKYGNSNASTIPMVITDNYADVLTESQKLCCLSGFGSGLSWAAAIMNMGKLDVCKMLISEF